MTVKELRRLIKSDMRYHGGTSFTKKWYVYLTNPSFRLLLNYRMGKFFKSKKGRIFNFIAAYYKYKQLTKRTSHISYNCEIGENVYFPHPISIVIGDGVVIEKNVKIWHNTTLGSHGRKTENKSFPHIKKGVHLYSNVTIIGGVTVGENALIGSKSLVLDNVEANTTVYGTPARQKVSK